MQPSLAQTTEHVGHAAHGTALVVIGITGIDASSVCAGMLP